MIKTIFIVTHGKRNSGPDPLMTEVGVEQVRALRDKLPESPSFVLCGTGRRMRQVADTLGLTPNAYSSAVGNSDAQDVDEDKSEWLVFANGDRVPFALDRTDQDFGPSVEKIVRELPHNSVITTGRAIVIGLGVPLKEAKSGVVYAAEIGDDRQIYLRVIR